MSKDQLAQAALALPLAERVSLAEALWQSIDDGMGRSGSDEDRQALDDARRRDGELTAGTTTGRTHEEVMETVRRAIECA